MTLNPKKQIGGKVQLWDDLTADNRWLVTSSRDKTVRLRASQFPQINILRNSLFVVQ